MDARRLVILLASSESPCIARHQHSGAPNTDLCRRAVKSCSMLDAKLCEIAPLALRVTLFRVCIFSFQGFQQVQSLRIGLRSSSRIGNLRPQLAALQ